MSSRYDAVVVGGGHNGLTAAAYLAQAGRSVLVVERAAHVGGAAVSAEVFPGVDARLSRYAYLVSLLPRQIIDELRLPIALRRRRFSSYTPYDGAGLLVDNGDARRTASSFEALTGSHQEWTAWQEFYGRLGRAAERIFPTVTSPLLAHNELRTIVDDDDTWRLLFDEPIGAGITSTFDNDVVRGVVLTDALIGTFADADEASLRQNRCFLYHVIGNGTGEWDVPVGGMGAVTRALHDVAVRAGAVVVTDATVTAIDPDGEVAYVDGDGVESRVGARRILAACAPRTLAHLLGEEPDDAPEGSQLKINMLLKRLPRLRSGDDPVAAFSGTFHINESYSQLQEAYRQAAAGNIPDLPPCEVYCHTLTDPSILGPSLQDAGVHTMTLFGLHMPARLFTDDADGARARAETATIASLNSVLAEPIVDCLVRDADGALCLETRTPVDLEQELGLPGGHIFHRDLSWPFAEHAAEVGTWGVETDHPRVLLCGAGARRGGGVSGIPGRAAAMSLVGSSW